MRIIVVWKRYSERCLLLCQAPCWREQALQNGLKSICGAPFRRSFGVVGECESFAFTREIRHHATLNRYLKTT
ncbi:hypothetical protein [Paraburkholderia sp.]|uniref:hypothetical protein n=1 Tax=Paraburkholderia sp. TaxID=1926495 RepID=UPI0039E454B5